MLPAVTREVVRIEGPRGTLAGELAYADGPAVAACLLINPHPHMGGAMSNNLIVRLAEELPPAGVVTLRFDYAGVGESAGRDIDVHASMAQFWATGTTPEDPLMVEDARAAASWLRAQAETEVFLVGYSFGAYAATAILEQGMGGAVLISPTVQRHDFSRLAGSQVPKLIIYGDDDFATPVAATEQWIRSLSHVRATHCMAGGDHFFRGMEGRMGRLCAEFIVAQRGSSI